MQLVNEKADLAPDCNKRTRENARERWREASSTRTSNGDKDLSPGKMGLVSRRKAFVSGCGVVCRVQNLDRVESGVYFFYKCPLFLTLEGSIRVVKRAQKLAGDQFTGLSFVGNELTNETSYDGDGDGDGDGPARWPSTVNAPMMVACVP